MRLVDLRLLVRLAVDLERRLSSWHARIRSRSFPRTDGSCLDGAGWGTYLASVVHLTDVVDLPFVPDVRFAHDYRDKEAGLALQLDRWCSFSASVLDLRRRVRSDLSLFEGAGAMLVSRQTHLL